MKSIKNEDVEFKLKTPLQNSENRPLNLEEPKDLNYVDLALQQNEYQQNDYFKKQAVNKGSGRPSNITEQINNIIEKGRDKDIEDRKNTKNKRFNLLYMEEQEVYVKDFKENKKQNIKTVF